MKIAPAAAEKFLRAPPAAVRAVLIYGPDTGLVRERAAALIKQVAGDESDPFRVAELTAAALREDPARLADEAQAMALTGGRRAVRVRDADDKLFELFESFLAQPPGDALVVVEAGSLAQRSKLRALFEGAAQGAAVVCYADEGRALQGVIRDTLGARHITVSGDALAYLVGHLGADRLVSRTELEKLALYVGDGREATLADAAAVVGDSAAMTLEDLAFAATGGDLAGLARALDRAWREGAQPVAVLRAVDRHLTRMSLVAGLVAEGTALDSAMRKLRPPVFYKYADAFQGQLRRWPPRALGAALVRLTEAEIQCKSTGLPDQTICAQALTRLCAEARARHGR